jgi:hypothetical protein
VACHTSNSDQATWRAPAWRPDCAGCHASRFKPDPHTRYTTPQKVLYSVAELKDCSGACHVYRDSSLTTIVTRRSGPEHRVTDEDFD